MGEAPAFFVDKLQKEFSNGCDLNSIGFETATIIGQKTYVVGGVSEESTLSSGVKIFDQSIGDWVTPTVLGTRPELSKGHSAVVLNDERILILKKGSSADDFAWFLEVDTQYVRQQKKILGTEVVAWSKGERGNAETPVVLSGPSGVGKGTLISMLMKEFPSMFGFSVSHTTRAPRGKEKDGVHYHFTDRSVMEEEIKHGKFLEFASVHGNLYGTSVEAVEVVANSGKRCILDIDVQGARSVRASSVEAIFIFVCPPSMEELEKRLRARGTETEEQILKRLKNAKEEMEQGQNSGIFDHILYNDNLEDCYENLKKLLRLRECVDVSAKTGMNPTVGTSLIITDEIFFKFNTVQIPIQDSIPEKIDLPLDHSITKNDHKVIINCSAPQQEKVSNKSIVLDVSSLKGGAPGRTRGLLIYATDSFSDCLNE